MTNQKMQLGVVSVIVSDAMPRDIKIKTKVDAFYCISSNTYPQVIWSLKFMGIFYFWVFFQCVSFLIPERIDYL